MNIEPTLAVYELNENQIKMLIRRLRYGDGLAAQLEQPGAAVALQNLIHGLEESLRKADLAKAQVEPILINLPRSPTSVLAIHQMD
jgi:hypothetical protein